ncbi:MAG TPA: hypothetical protein H9907_06720, partial [Candidatus Corynebacterium intestinavium]|nr:hypothetical protein [Candidatus Corynebacterium intestinavium]
LEQGGITLGLLLGQGARTERATGGKISEWKDLREGHNSHPILTGIYMKITFNIDDHQYVKGVL